MKRNFKRFVQCGVLSLGVMCQESHSMIADTNLIDQGRRHNGLSADVPQRDIENQHGVVSSKSKEVASSVNHFSAHVTLSSLGVDLGIYDDTAFSTRVCVTAACVVGALVTLHLFGVM